MALAALGTARSKDMVLGGGRGFLSLSLSTFFLCVGFIVVTHLGKDGHCRPVLQSKKRMCPPPRYSSTERSIKSPEEAFIGQTQVTCPFLGGLSITEVHTNQLSQKEQSKDARQEGIMDFILVIVSRTTKNRCKNLLL